ncbi:hypothetical protein [Rhodococcoides yunnanense]|uniref:hypothetical protein n=1 Tax=Rhodococcoides yunnanense TaxID=278209 RepID=UPI0009354ECF|nr:hypothetical protein [Rhodococcus yunnanensis]
MNFDMTDAVVWPDAPERERWWHTVLGIESDVSKCATSHFIDQQLGIPRGDDGYPSILRTPAA